MAMQYDSGDYPACQAEVLDGGRLGRFPARQAEARAQGRYIGIGLAHGVKGTGRGPFESGLVRIVADRHASPSSPAPPPSARASAPRWRRSAAEQLGVDARGVTVVAGDTAGVSLGLGGFASRQTVTAGSSVHARRARGAEKAQQGRRARAGGGRARSGNRRRRGPRRRRAAARRQARRDRAHPAGRARLRLSARRRARARSERELPHRCARLCQRLPCRRSRGRHRDRRACKSCASRRCRIPAC